MALAALLTTDLSGGTRGPITWVGIGAIGFIAFLAWFATSEHL